MLTLSIVVVLYNSSTVAATFLECLQSQTFKDWRLILVDNSPADGVGQSFALLGDPRISVHANSSNEGFARAVNRGLRIGLAQGAMRHLLLNPDVTFGPEFLQALMERWSEHGADVIAPRIMYQDQPDKAWYAGGWLDFGWTFSNRHASYDPASPQMEIVDFASGCCLGLTTSLLDDVGLLDESFFVYWEDTDFCLRLKTAGRRIIYVNDPVLFHQAGISSGGEFSPTGVNLYYISYAQLLKKHFGIWDALVMTSRTARVEAHRKDAGLSHCLRVTLALVKGLLTPSKPVPRL
jgi:GT2 family glycosyltransferase